MILSSSSANDTSSEAAGITRCFKEDCGCRSKLSQNGFDSSSVLNENEFAKLQSDLRIEHLLLEKEV